MTSPSQPIKHELPRVLSATNALAIVVGIIIGSGIFLVPREMMAAVGSSRMVYAVWITGGLLSLFGAMSYAELAAMKPRVGGEYAFLHDAYGPLTAFLYTWTWTTVAKPASIATIAAGLMRVLGTFQSFAFLHTEAVAHLLWSQVLAIAATWLITGLNIVSTVDSANVQTALTWLKVLMIVVIAGFCFTSLQHGSFHNLTTSFTGARGGIAGFMVALIAALWAYDGWSDVSQMAGEVKDPQRSMPLALVGGVAIVGGLYMLTNAAIQYVLPAATIAHAERPAADAMRLVAGNAGAALVSIGMAVSICATFVGSSLSGARVPFAAAQDRLFPSVLAKIHPRFHTPYASLIMQAVLSTLLLLAIGKFQALFSLAIFSEWLFYALTTASVFIFRAREPETPRPYRVTGYPVVPALFVLAALALLVFSFMDQPRNSALGTVVILCGIPVHYLFQRRQQRQQAQ
ncbi:APC family permease [Granulicella paludicola]|uniref:APC family permease n=1 Tax=Granulicella paludicola TaxID=474951 RepID=UPI0021E0BBB9|nr:amino acid permease [Granulicella paludicola]